MVEELVQDKLQVEKQVDAYRNKLRKFYPGDEHLWMAALAAFPVAMTVRLMYQLWVNFKILTDTEGNTIQLPVLAVSDCILSDLFRATGKDSFEMQSSTRAYLINQLEKKCGPALIKELASFLYRYALNNKADNPWKNFYEAQEWTAMMAVDAEKAASNIFESLRDHIHNKDTFQTIGVANLIATLVKENDSFASLIKGTLESKKGEGETTLTPASANGEKKYAISLRPTASHTAKRVQLELPAGVSSRLLSVYESNVAVVDESVTAPTGKVVGLLVALNKYKSGMTNLTQSLQDADKMKGLLTKMGAAETRSLYDEEATKANVITVLEDCMFGLNQNDILVFYFCGQATYENEEHQLYLYDSMGKKKSTSHGILTSLEFRSLISSKGDKGPTIVLVLDSCHVGSSQWFEENNTRHIALLGTHHDDLSYEGKESFTNVLADTIINNSVRLTYKNLYQLLVEITMKQTPVFLVPDQHWDNYFLTNEIETETDTTLRILEEIGYSVVKNEPGNPENREAISDFREEYSLTEKENIYESLAKARLLSRHRKINVCCLWNNISESMFYVPKIKAALGNRRTDVTLTSYHRPEPDDTSPVHAGIIDKSIIATVTHCHFLLIGLNRKLCSDPSYIKEMKVVLGIAKGLDIITYCLLEEECDWHSTPFANVPVLPANHLPANSSEGLDDLLDRSKDFNMIFDDLEKYLALFPSTEPQQQDIAALIEQAHTTHELYLSGRNISKIDESFLIPGLKVLDLSENKLDKVPLMIGQLHDLEVLMLGRNKLIRELPDVLGNLPKLRVLDINHTLISTLPDSIIELQNLRELDISGTEIRVVDPRWLNDNLILHCAPEKIINFPPIPKSDANARDNVVKNMKHMWAIGADQVESEAVFLEISSRKASSRYKRLARKFSDKIPHHFYNDITSPARLFDLLRGHRSKHIFVYLEDVNGVLMNAFGELDRQQQAIYYFFRALRRPLNIVINNPLIGPNSFADLAGDGELNFVALSTNTEKSVMSHAYPNVFPDMFFDSLYSLSPKKSNHVVIAHRNSEDAEWLAAQLQEYNYTFEYISFDAAPAESLSPQIKNARAIIALINDQIRPSELEQGILSVMLKESHFMNIPLSVFAAKETRALRIGNIPGLEELRKSGSYSRYTGLQDLLKRVLAKLENKSLVVSQSSLSEMIDSLKADAKREGYNLYYNPEKMRDYIADPVIARQPSPPAQPYQSVGDAARLPFATDIYKKRIAIYKPEGILEIYPTNRDMPVIRKVKASASHAAGINLLRDTLYIKTGEYTVATYAISSRTYKKIVTDFPIQKIETSSHNGVSIIGSGIAWVYSGENRWKLIDPVISAESRVVMIKEYNIVVLYNQHELVIFRNLNRTRSYTPFTSMIYAACLAGDYLAIAGADEGEAEIRFFNISDLSLSTTIKSIPFPDLRIYSMSYHNDTLLVATSDGTYKYKFHPRRAAEMDVQIEGMQVFDVKLDIASNDGFSIDETGKLFAFDLKSGQGWSLDLKNPDAIAIINPREKSKRRKATAKKAQKKSPRKK